MARRVAGIFPLIFVLCMRLFPVPCRAAGITVVDDAGRTVVLAAPAERIVSFYAGHSENILALGGAGRLVGIAEGDDETLFPGVPRLPMRADAERILALAPDLVLVRPLAESVNEGVLRTLERSGVPVVSLSPPIPETMEAYLERLSSLLGAEGGVNRRSAGSIGAAGEADGVHGADERTLPAANATHGVDRRHAIGHSDRAELAALLTGAAADAECLVDHGEECGTGDCGRDVELGDAPEHAAAAGAAVADVVLSRAVVAHTVDQASLFRLV